MVGSVQEKLTSSGKKVRFLDISNVDLSDACVRNIIFLTEKHANYDKFSVWGAVPP